MRQRPQLNQRIFLSFSIINKTFALSDPTLQQQTLNWWYETLVQATPQSGIWHTLSQDDQHWLLNQFFPDYENCLNHLFNPSPSPSDDWLLHLEKLFVAILSGNTLASNAHCAFAQTWLLVKCRRDGIKPAAISSALPQPPYLQLSTQLHQAARESFRGQPPLLTYTGLLHLWLRFNQTATATSFTEPGVLAKWWRVLRWCRF